MPDAAPTVDLGIDRSVLSRRNRPMPLGTSYAPAPASEQTTTSDEATQSSKRAAKKQPGKSAVKKSTVKRTSRATTTAKKTAPATSAKPTRAQTEQQAKPSAPTAVPSAAPTPTPATAAEDQALAAAAEGQPASSTVDTPERPPRRVASVPSALAGAIAERCQRTGMRRRELVLAALETHAHELADLVAKDNAPKVKKVGLWEVPVDKKTSGHMTINMHLTSNNAVIMDDLVRRSGARGISQAVTVALAAYLDVQDM